MTMITNNYISGDGEKVRFQNELPNFTLLYSHSIFNSSYKYHDSIRLISM